MFRNEKQIDRYLVIFLQMNISLIIRISQYRFVITKKNSNLKIHSRKYYFYHLQYFEEVLPRITRFPQYYRKSLLFLSGKNLPTNIPF